MYGAFLFVYYSSQSILRQIVSPVYCLSDLVSLISRLQGAGSCGLGPGFLGENRAEKSASEASRAHFLDEPFCVAKNVFCGRKRENIVEETF